MSVGNNLKSRHLQLKSSKNANITTRYRVLEEKGPKGRKTSEVPDMSLDKSGL